jgi:hypothetical protein
LHTSCEWKRQLLERAADVFDGGISAAKPDNETDIKTPHAKIDQLALENDFLKQFADMAVDHQGQHRPAIASSPDTA